MGVIRQEDKALPAILKLLMPAGVSDASGFMRTNEAVRGGDVL